MGEEESELYESLTTCVAAAHWSGAGSPSATRHSVSRQRHAARGVDQHICKVNQSVLALERYLVTVSHVANWQFVKWKGKSAQGY